MKVKNNNTEIPKKVKMAMAVCFSVSILIIGAAFLPLNWLNLIIPAALVGIVSYFS